jgi:chemotaxis protein MotB
MARKKHHEEPENHERWLVSYADFITLLFAFFVVMYSISSVNEGKYRVLSNSLGNAFGHGPSGPPAFRDSGPPALPLAPRSMQAPSMIRPRNDVAMRREKDQMTGLARDLLKALAPLVREGKVRVTQSLHGISVEISASVLFAPGDARLSPPSGEALRAVAQVLKDDTHAIQVEGHTDNVPISNAAFPSNWELSAVRASSVVRLFVDNGVAESRLLAIGHGANQPVGSNDTPAGRLRNRRVQLMILSGLPETVTEVPVVPATSVKGVP